VAVLRFFEAVPLKRFLRRLSASDQAAMPLAAAAFAGPLSSVANENRR
jgi:hypothetical protein